MRNPRIFMGFDEISGYFGSLERGFRALGVPCDFWELGDHPSAYWTRRGAPAALRWLRRRRSGLFGRAAFLFAYGLLFVYCLMRYDVFIFSFGASFYRYRDLPLLRLFGKRIVYVFLGSDSRPPYLDGSVMASDRGRDLRDCLELTRARKQAIATIERYASFCVNHPPMAHFHTKPFVLGLLLGFPISRELPSAGAAARPASVRILHSPSHPEAKGSEQIAKAIETLREKGHAIDYVVLTGRSNDEVLRELAACDFVVDQLYSDVPIAGFATEAALMGKPAVVGGYYAPNWPDFPPDRVPPSHYCHPDHLEDAIEQMVRDEAYRLELGRRAQAFVAGHWQPAQVAGRLLEVIRTGGDPALWYDPHRIRLVHGACLSEPRAQSLVRGLLRLGGIGALQLRDKPALEKEMLAFAERDRDVEQAV